MLIRAYTDGACSGNPGPGGYGVIVCLDKETTKISGFEKDTTNNRMELKAVIEAIDKIHDMIFQEKIKTDELEIISDSAYVINSINKNWLEFWRKNNFKTSKGKSVKNTDLWLKLIELLETSEFINVKISFVKIKGHDGNYFNEEVDKIARSEIEKCKKVGN